MINCKGVNHWFNPLIIWCLFKEMLRDKSYGAGLTIMGMILVSYAVVYTIPTIWVYNMFGDKPIWNYSNGVMQASSAKLSKKGIIWDTNEGYILTGGVSEGVAEKWHFSTQSQEVVNCINSNKNVSLTYKHYIIVPYKIGGANHIVTECKGL